jgi:hypothetical protein
MVHAILWVTGNARHYPEVPGATLVTNYVCDVGAPMPATPTSFTQWLKAGWRIVPGATPSTAELHSTTIVLEHD